MSNYNAIVRKLRRVNSAPYMALCGEAANTIKDLSETVERLERSLLNAAIMIEASANQMRNAGLYSSKGKSDA